ncbi:hypothetical protein [Variovorax saccharolyticus]|uniref:hypothetical protein n=1 Tax=Variovorax saccharolyticus TaxID=3053516 RepID=UPI002576E551|nr:hypothetical protein [Variovorax sp. J31P216]MDM0029598.1 hypothetical protein [Variovorax sp. J31P216]
MIKVLSIDAKRSENHLEATPDGHWVRLVFENAHGTHSVELNGTQALPIGPEVRDDLEFLLWDYGLLEQQDSCTSEDRVAVAQDLMDRDLNHRLARDYLRDAGATLC